MDRLYRQRLTSLAERLRTNSANSAEADEALAQIGELT